MNKKAEEQLRKDKKAFEEIFSLRKENLHLRQENAALKAENERLFCCLHKVMKARNIKARMDARDEAEAIIASKEKEK